MNCLINTDSEKPETLKKVVGINRSYRPLFFPFTNNSLAFCWCIFNLLNLKIEQNSFKAFVKSSANIFLPTTKGQRSRLTILESASDWSMAWKGICSSSQQSVVEGVETTANANCDSTFGHEALAEAKKSHRYINETF